MNKFFIHDYQHHNLIFKEKEDNIIYFADKLNRLLYYDEDLSLAYQACSIPKVKLMFGRPDYFLQLEDLALTLSVEELRTIFIKTIY
jgi:hypothetical protein